MGRRGSEQRPGAQNRSTRRVEAQPPSRDIVQSLADAGIQLHVRSQIDVCPDVSKV